MTLAFRKMSGEAAEHFVLYKLLSWGIPAVSAPESIGFDIVAFHENRPIRIQVKSSCKLRNETSPLYRFTAKKGARKNSRPYDDGEYDILACVSTDIDKVAFLPFVTQQSIYIHKDDMTGDCLSLLEIVNTL